MTVREMLARIGADELDDWASYERVYGPLGAERADALAALVATSVYNAQRTKRSDPVMKVQDQMPTWDRKRPQQSWQEQLAMAKHLNAAFGGSVKEA